MTAQQRRASSSPSGSQSPYQVSSTHSQDRLASTPREQTVTQDTSHDVKTVLRAKSEKGMGGEEKNWLGSLGKGADTSANNPFPPITYVGSQRVNESVESLLFGLIVILLCIKIQKSCEPSYAVVVAVVMIPTTIITLYLAISPFIPQQHHVTLELPHLRRHCPSQGFAVQSAAFLPSLITLVHILAPTTTTTTTTSSSSSNSISITAKSTLQTHDYIMLCLFTLLGVVLVTFVECMHHWSRRPAADRPRIDGERERVEREAKSSVYSRANILTIIAFPLIILELLTSIPSFAPHMSAAASTAFLCSTYAYYIMTFVLRHAMRQSFTLAESSLVASLMTGLLVFFFSHVASSVGVLSLAMKQEAHVVFVVSLISLVLCGGLTLLLFVSLGLIKVPDAMYASLATNDTDTSTTTSSSSRRRRRAVIVDQQEVRSVNGPVSSALVTYVVMGAYLALLLVWLQYCLGENPVLWALNRAMQRGPLFLAFYWVGILIATAFLAPYVLQHTRQIIFRKLYHFVMVALLTPGVFYLSTFLSLSLSIALALVIVVECIRALRVWPLGSWVHRVIAYQIDERDSGTVVMTHLYLILGCSFPIWMSTSTPSNITVTCPTCLLNPAHTAPLCGVLILGLGDAMASIVGVQFGRSRWPGLAHKSIEGSLAALGVCLVFPVLLALILPCPTITTSTIATTTITTSTTSRVLTLLACSWWQVGGFTIATAATIVLEAYTTQIDNLFLPVFYLAAIVYTI